MTCSRSCESIDSENVYRFRQDSEVLLMVVELHVSEDSNHVPFSSSDLSQEVLDTVKTELQNCYFSFDEYSARRVEYDINYTRKELCLIAGYYGVPTRKMSKTTIAENIALFECDPVNQSRVAQRLECWAALETMKNDPYMRKFLILA